MKSDYLDKWEDNDNFLTNLGCAFIIVCLVGLIILLISLFI
jgi:hypothetical protein